MAWKFSAGSELGQLGGSPSGSVPFLSGRCPVLPKVQCLKVIVAYVFTYILAFFMGKGRSGLFLHLGHKWTLISDVPFVANILPLHSQPFQCRLLLCPSHSCLSSDRPYASLPVPGACRFLPRKLLFPGPCSSVSPSSGQCRPLSVLSPSLFSPLLLPKRRFQYPSMHVVCLLDFPVGHVCVCTCAFTHAWRWGQPCHLCIVQGSVGT